MGFSCGPAGRLRPFFSGALGSLGRRSRFLVAAVLRVARALASKRSETGLEAARKACRVDGASAADTTKAPPTARFPELPDVLDALGAACCDPVLLTRLSLASTSLHGFLGDTHFAERRARELADSDHAWAEGCSSLEQMAVGLKVEELCGGCFKNHLYFPYGGGTKVTRQTVPLVDGAAILLKGHVEVRLHVDAHVGRGAPLGIATRTARMRAERVISEFVDRGVERERLTATAWGKRISAVWSEPEDERAPRAEVYFRIGSKEFPERPDYYQLVPEDKHPRGMPAGTISNAEGSEGSTRAAQLQMQVALWVERAEGLHLLHGILSDDSDDQGEEASHHSRTAASEPDHEPSVQDGSSSSEESSPLLGE